jgi:hypothetical protein
MSVGVRAYRELRKRLRPLRAAYREAHGAFLQVWTNYAWRTRAERRAQPHQLGRPLIISLTSHPPRYKTLAFTLRCLMMQDIRPDRVVLWIAHDDLVQLPGDVCALRAAGLEIEPCEDLGSYKKLTPALRRWPDAFIATADDDVYYPRGWLRDLVASYDPAQNIIPCHRAHQIAIDRDGAPRAYAAWRFEAPPRADSALTFPTGVGGVLYPPGALHADTVDARLFTRLAPTSDDAWFYFMARRQGWRFQRISKRRFIAWPRSQASALMHSNVAGANDAQLARLVNTFGFPPAADRTQQRPEEAHAW